MDFYPGPCGSFNPLSRPQSCPQPPRFAPPPRLREPGPRLDFPAESSMETILLQGCWLEAQRADVVALVLHGLQVVLTPGVHEQLLHLVNEIRATSHALRCLADAIQKYSPRVHFVLDHLNVLLPCLCRTLMNMTAYYEDRSCTRTIRWRRMCRYMTEEAGGLPLAGRFFIYHSFLGLLIQLLVRAPPLSITRLEELRSRILQLRELRNIPPPPPILIDRFPRRGGITAVGTEELVCPLPAAFTSSHFARPGMDQGTHWAEQILSLPLTSRTPLKTEPSLSFGPFTDLAQLSPPVNSRTLFQRSFDEDLVSLTVYLDPNEVPYFFIRMFRNGTPLYSLRGAHELCIHRLDGSIILNRWSRTQQTAKPWAQLSFPTWEELVLFYCTFVALKARDIKTVSLRPSEYKLRNEVLLFQAKIHDDKFYHTLIVYEDEQTCGLRLHAAVWEGQLQRCPVWTAFITQRFKSSRWIGRKGQHHVLLRDVQLYVFCQEYNEENMRRNKSGDFEVEFVSPNAASHFCDLFNTYFAPPESIEPSEVASVRSLGTLSYYNEMDEGQTVELHVDTMPD